MADLLLCLDIHKDALAAVVVDKSSRITLVTGCAAADAVDQSFAEALDQIKEQTGFTGGPCLVTFGAELFSFRNVTLPFSDRSKIGQALPFELADQSPVDINSLLIDFIVAKSGSSGTDIVAAMINRDYLASHLGVLTAAGLNPDSIGISGLATALQIADGPVENFVLIDSGARWASLFIVVNKQVALIRSLAVQPEADGLPVADDTFVQYVSQTVLACQLLDTGDPNYKIFLTGSESRIATAAPVLSSRLGGVEIAHFHQSSQPLVKIEPDIQTRYKPELMDRVLAQVYKNGKKSGGFNFRTGDFRKKKSLLEYRGLILKTALPAALLIVCGLIYVGYTYSKLTAEQESLRRQIAAVFTETLPEVTRVVNPVQQLQVKNNEIRATYSPGGANGAGYTIIELLTELSIRIPAQEPVKVVRMVADMDTIRLKAVTGDFNTVDNVQKDLERSPYFKDVTISSANQSIKGDEVNFELKLELARK